MPELLSRSKGFNSLQTGRSFRTQILLSDNPSTKRVSIPFKREGLSELSYLILCVSIPNCFNSLQTGRSFRTWFTPIAFGSVLLRFNSLQTGRSFRTQEFIFNEPRLHGSHVSIPFKREGLSERDHRNTFFGERAQFQFPSNGKVFPNNRRINCWSWRQLFQFPSNGKVFPNMFSVVFFSIYFDRFNSLQTGRSFRTHPPANPVTVRAKLAKTKHELRGAFFCENYY